MKKKKKIILIIISIIFIIGMSISIYNIAKWFKDSNKTKEELNEINELVTIEESNGEDVEIITPASAVAKESPYWEYIKMNLINVDFSQLKEINSDVLGWITVNGTNINYPFVQTDDNDYYLDHSFKKEKNSAGWVFLDYRNDINNLDKNTIIYAHNRKDQTMFGTLKKVITNSWLNDTNNYVVKLSTEVHNTLWQVFSVYSIPTTNDYIQTEFTSNEEFVNLANTLISRSVHDFNTPVDAEDKILTLSTCHGSEKKLVLHAKLIKIENR